MPVSLKIQEINDFFYYLPVTQFIAPQPQEGMEGVFFELDMSAKKQVVQHRHMEEKAQILKCSCDALLGDGIGREPGEAFSMK